MSLVVRFSVLLQANPYFRTTVKSANDLLAAVFETSPRLRDKYLDGTALCEVSPEAVDAKKREMVWRESVRLAGLTEQDAKLVRWD